MGNLNRVEERMVVRVTAGSSEYNELLLRQTPGRSGFWRGMKFVVNAPVEKCDWWVVLHSTGLQASETVLCDPAHTVFVSMEPPEGSPSKRFLQQFSHVVSADPGIADVHRINGLTWWVGIEVAFAERGHQFSKSVRYDYDSLCGLRPPSAKRDRVSVITSSKSHLPGHRRRLEFLERLKAHPVSRHIDFFGGYHNPITDKFDALLGYKYHLALENTVLDDMWTEKIADPLLAWSLPIYHGCPNISRYLPAGSFLKIDIEDFGASVQAIETAVARDAYSESLGQIEAARDLVLNRYNIFNVLADICSTPAETLAPVTLHPARKMRPSLASRIAARVRRLSGRH